MWIISCIMEITDNFNALLVRIDITLHFLKNCLFYYNNEAL